MLNKKPSVVMLTPDRKIDRRILLSADSLEAAGWDVIIIAMANDEWELDDKRVIRIGSNIKYNNYENLVLYIYRWVRFNFPMNGKLMRALKRLAWRYFVDQEEFYFKLFYNTASKYLPTVFVANDLPMLPVAKRLAVKCGAKLVYDSHELYSEQEFSNREKQRWAAIESKYIGACDVIITVNKSISDELEQRYGVKNIKIIYNAENIYENSKSLREFHKKFGLSDNKKILLMQGGLSSGRNLNTLIECMKYVQNKEIILVILGEGYLLKDLKKLTRNYNLTNTIYFHDAVAQEKLIHLTASADVGIIPYQPICINNYYCTPNKLFEYIAAGIPIIATDLPEIKKIIIDNEIGLVGDTSSSVELAKLIDDFFSNTENLKKMKSNVLLAQKLYCWQTEGMKLVEIYRGLQ